MITSGDIQVGILYDEILESNVSSALLLIITVYALKMRIHAIRLDCLDTQQQEYPDTESD